MTAVLLVVVGLGMFGLGETLWAPVALLIGNGLVHLWVACTVGGTALAAVLFLNLRRHLSPLQDGRRPAEVELAA